MNIGNKHFPTKKACEEYTRQLIKSLDICEIRKGSDNYEYFDKLLEYHKSYEEKIGCGIDYFYITRNPIKWSDLMTMICRVDGSSTNFSWKKCSNARFGTDFGYLNRALRNSISDVVIKFKKENELICCECKVKNLPYSEYHCDHVYPFSKLRDDFLNGRQYPKMFTDRDYNKVFRDEDKEFEDAWIGYHNSIATFQILCRNCNEKKSDN